MELTDGVFFEVIKWMDIDRRLKKKNPTSISDLVHTGGGTPHFDCLVRTYGSQLAITPTKQ